MLFPVGSAIPARIRPGSHPTKTSDGICLTRSGELRFTVIGWCRSSFLQAHMLSLVARFRKAWTLILLGLVLLSSLMLSVHGLSRQVAGHAAVAISVDDLEYLGQPVPSASDDHPEISQAAERVTLQLLSNKRPLSETDWTFVESRSVAGSNRFVLKCSQQHPVCDSTALQFTRKIRLRI